MHHRNKWIVSLFCGAVLLGVVACARPVTTTADSISTGNLRADKTSFPSTKDEGKPGGTVTKLPDEGKESKDRPPSTKGSEPDAGKPQPAPVGYEFPGDQGGSLMKRLLTPRDSLVSAESQSAPLRRKPLRRVEDPSPGLPRFDPTLPRISMYGPAIPARPTFVIPENILGDAGLTLALPEGQQMPTGPLLKVPSVDVNKPMSLAPMAQPLSGREPNTDPTKAASAEAAIKATMPTRTNPAPFIPESLPDPFENEAAVRKLAPSPEEALPLGGSSQPPKK